MVEMLAVLAVIAVLIALALPNGTFARTTGEEAAVQAQCAALEAAMSQYLTRNGAAAVTTYAATTKSLADVYALLSSNNALPPSITQAQLESTFSGYTVVFPTNLSGSVSALRTADGATIYP